jgi:predicted ATPase
MWFLGHPDAALDEGRKAVVLAERIGRPYSRVYALGLLASIHQLRGEGEEAGQYANQVVQLSTEQEFAYWLAWGRIVGGWAVAAQGLPMAGIEQMRDGLAAYLATGADQMRPYALTLLAASCGQDGQTGDALNFLDQVEAPELLQRARYYDAEMHRLRGELTFVRVGDPVKATEFFQQALATARAQGARSLELRAALSLARLQADNGDSRLAYRTLEPVFAQFSEGFTTTDLREAQMFLATL